MESSGITEQVISILYVDDEPGFLDIVKLTLERSGEFNITTALNASTAIQLLTEHPYDAIVSDYQMPEMDGIAFLKVIRQQFGQIPFILFTGRGREEVVIDAINNGADFYLQKGGDMKAQFAELSNKIRYAVSRRHVELDLRESEERYRNVVEDQTEFICRFLPDGTHVFVNEAYCHYFGLTREEIIGSRFRPNLPPEDRKAVARLIDSLTPDHPLGTIDQRIIMPDGNIRWQRWVDRAIYHDDGSVKEYQSVGRDITELKKIEQALRESEEQYRTVFENTGTATVVIEEDTIISLANAEFTRLSGYSRGEIEGKKCWTEFVVKEDLERMLAQHQLRRQNHEKALTRYEFRFVTKSGDIRNISLSIDVFPGTKKSIASLQDITNWKKADEALIESREKLRARFDLLKESQEKLHTVLDNLPDLVLVHRNGTILYVNPAMIDTLGIQPDEVLQKSVLDYIAPEYRALVTKAMQKRVETGLDEPYEIELLSHLGGHRDVLIRGSLIEFDGSPAILNVLTDITVQKRAEKALRESEEKFRTLVETSPDIIWETDLQGNFLYISPMVTRILGYLPEEIIGKSITDLVPEWGHSYTLKELAKMALCDGPLSPIEAPARDRNGRELVLEIRPSKFIGSNGKLDRLRGVAVDITERKRTEEALREYENKFAIVFRNSPVASTLISLQDATFIDVNDAFVTKTGYSRDEIIGKKMEEMENFIDSADFEKIASIFMREGVVNGEEVKFRTKSGEIQTCLYSASAIQLNGTPHILSNVEDISARKRMENALRMANHQINLLSSITRHDILNQLQVLRGFLSILEETPPGPTYDEYFQNVSHAAERISAMIQFTEEYGSIGITAPAWQDCRTLVDTVAKEILLGNVIVKNDLPAGGQVFADPMVVKVFYNLMDNAIRYGGKITAIRFFTEDREKDEVIVCEDDGFGVPAEEKAKIFERGIGKNTGLGLALSREILAITGITITETGEPGKGARFEIVVPKDAWQITGDLNT